MKKWFLLLFCAFAIAFVAIPTADAYTVKGMGKCKGWIGGEDDRFWLLGFLSGYNYAKDANVGRGVESGDIYKFVTRFCRERPGDDRGDAVTAYIATQ